MSLRICRTWSSLDEFGLLIIEKSSDRRRVQKHNFCVNMRLEYARVAKVRPNCFQVDEVWHAGPSCQAQAPQSNFRVILKHFRVVHRRFQFASALDQSQGQSPTVQPRNHSCREASANPAQGILSSSLIWVNPQSSVGKGSCARGIHYDVLLSSYSA